MTRKLVALLGLLIALIPPTLFVLFHLIDSTAFAALAIALMGGVSTYIHSVALEDAAEKGAGGAPAAPTATVTITRNEGQAPSPHTPEATPAPALPESAKTTTSDTSP